VKKENEIIKVAVEDKKPELHKEEKTLSKKEKRH
jgi:hypothetical protein